MFESSTFDSMGTIHTRSRNWMFATFALNTSVLALLVAIPLLHPAMLPRILNPIRLQPPTPVEEPKPVVRQAAPAARSNAEVLDGRIQAPRLIPKNPWIPTAAEPPRSGNSMSLGGPIAPSGAGCDPFNCGRAQSVVQQTAQPKPRLTSSVMQGMLLYKVLPIYPLPARAMRIGGRVELQAAISRSGAIENLRVASGPALLRRAAIDAVKQWRYRPYLLNGQPVEVETTIDVDFTLN